MKAYHITPTTNIPSILKNGLCPLIGERSQDYEELEPAIYLFKTLKDVENACMNWLGEYFEDEQLSLIEVNLSNIDYESNSLEYMVFNNIDMKNLTILSEDIDNFDFTLKKFMSSDLTIS